MPFILPLKNLGFQLGLQQRVENVPMYLICFLKCLIKGDLTSACMSHAHISSSCVKDLISGDLRSATESHASFFYYLCCSISGFSKDISYINFVSTKFYIICTVGVFSRLDIDCVCYFTLHWVFSHPKPCLVISAKC